MLSDDAGDDDRDDQPAPAGSAFADGIYDGFVIDATIEEAGDDRPRVVHLELTIIAGEHKGEVIAIAAAGLRGAEFDLIGMPATITVADGTPSVSIDR